MHSRYQPTTVHFDHARLSMAGTVLHNFEFPSRATLLHSSPPFLGLPEQFAIKQRWRHYEHGAPVFSEFYKISWCDSQLIFSFSVGWSWACQAWILKSVCARRTWTDDTSHAGKPDCTDLMYLGRLISNQIRTGAPTCTPNIVTWSYFVLRCVA